MKSKRISNNFTQSTHIVSYRFFYYLCTILRKSHTEMQSHSTPRRIRHILLFCISTILFVECTSAGSKESTPSDSSSAKEIAYSEYVADYDIAMTIRSIVDAISIGEPLDTAEYNYTGVLTDGRGTPLYTDIQGSPGEWQIDVMNESSVRIHNVYLGDLMPQYLSDYITESLQLDSANQVETDEYAYDDDTYVELYDFGSGDIRIETRTAYASNGLEGPLMSIVLTSNKKK